MNKDDVWRARVFGGRCMIKLLIFHVFDENREILSIDTNINRFIIMGALMRRAALCYERR